ncbi:MAG: hypothetical protein AAGH19_07515 [Pseudomonadota bacterium]
MEFLEQFVMSGRIVDLMLAVLVVETIWLAWRGKRLGKGLPLAQLITNAGAGGSLMLALKAVLTQAGLFWVVAALLASLVFHSSDLFLRWTSAQRSGTPGDPRAR